MPQIVPAGSLNLTALQDPDVYIQVLNPPNFVRGVPTDVIGLVGTASWGPTNLPVSLGSGNDAQNAFGPISNLSLYDPYDLATDLFLAFGQASSNATLQGFAVRVTDGTDTVASVSLTGSATAIPATATLTGTITIGDTLQLTFTSSGFTGSPVTVFYVTKTGDTLTTATAGLAAAVNNSAVLSAASIYALASGTIATLYSPSTLSPSLVVTRNVLGAATETITVGTGSTSTAGATAAALYTGILGAQVRVVVSANPKSTSSLNVAVSGFTGTTEQYIGIPSTNFWRTLQTVLAFGQANVRGPSQWLRLSAINAAVGAPTTGTYTLTGGSDGRTGVTTSIMLGSSTAFPATGLWSLNNTTPSVGVAWLTGVTDPTAAATLDSFALTTGCSVLFAFPTGTTTTAAITAVQNNGVAGPEFVYVKDSVYFQDTVNNMQRLVLPTAVIGGHWATRSPEQSPLNDKVQLVTGTERNNLISGTIPYSPSEIGQLNIAGVMFVSNPCPGGSYFGIRTAASTSPSAATAPVEYWRLTMSIAKSLDANLGIFVGQLQSQQPNDDLRNQVKLVLNAYAQNLQAAGQIDSGIGYCEYSNSPTAKYGNGVNTSTSVAQHYLYALFKATYLSSVWYFVCSIQGGTTVVTVTPGQA